MPQVSAASADAFLALLEYHDDFPPLNKGLLCYCKSVTERMEIPKDIGGWLRMLDEVNKCRMLCIFDIVLLTEYIDILDIRCAAAEEQLGSAVKLPFYKDPLGMVKKTREEYVKLKERYNDANMALLSAKEKIKPIIDDLKHVLLVNDQDGLGSQTSTVSHT